MLYVYCLESVLFLCTVHISYVPSGKCSFYMHSTHFWSTFSEEFSFCSQYIFLIYRLKSILFLCTVHVSDAQWFDIWLSNRYLVHVSCFLPWRQFQVLSNMSPEINFLMSGPYTKSWAHIRFIITLCRNG